MYTYYVIYLEYTITHTYVKCVQSYQSAYRVNTNQKKDTIEHKSPKTAICLWFQIFCFSMLQLPPCQEKLIPIH